MSVTCKVRTGETRRSSSCAVRHHIFGTSCAPFVHIQNTVSGSDSVVDNGRHCQFGVQQAPVCPSVSVVQAFAQLLTFPLHSACNTSCKCLAESLVGPMADVWLPLSNDILARSSAWQHPADMQRAATTTFLTELRSGMWRRSDPYDQHHPC